MHTSTVVDMMYKAKLNAKQLSILYNQDGIGSYMMNSFQLQLTAEAALSLNGACITDIDRSSCMQ